VARLKLCRNDEGWAGALPQHRRRALEEHISFVGLDVHKATIAVCVAEATRDATQAELAAWIAGGPRARAWRGFWRGQS
jgi:hypothetical protein